MALRCVCLVLLCLRLVVTSTARRFGIEFLLRLKARRDGNPLRNFFTRWRWAVGAFHASRGHRVPPGIRWTGPADCAFCFDGSTRGSAVSVSNYGSWRDPVIRDRFLIGLPVMIDVLEPSVVFAHGSTDHSLFRILQSKTAFIPLQTRWSSVITQAG